MVPFILALIALAKYAKLQRLESRATCGLDADYRDSRTGSNLDARVRKKRRIVDYELSNTEMTCRKAG